MVIYNKRENNYCKRGVDKLNENALNEYIDDDSALTIGRVVYFLTSYLKKALGDKYKPDPHFDDSGSRPYILMGNTKDGIQYISKEHGMSVLEISKEVDNLVCTDLRTNGGNVKDLFNGQMYARDKDGEKLAYVGGTAKNGLAEVSGANCSVLHILSANDKNCTLGNCVSEKVVNRIWEGLENLEEQNIEIFERENQQSDTEELNEDITGWEDGIVDIYEFDDVRIVTDCAAGWPAVYFTLDFYDGVVLDGSYGLINKNIMASTQDRKINFTYCLSNSNILINNIYDNDDSLMSLIDDIINCAEESMCKNVYSVELDSLEAIPD